MIGQITLSEKPQEFRSRLKTVSLGWKAVTRCAIMDERRTEEQNMVGWPNQSRQARIMDPLPHGGMEKKPEENMLACFPGGRGSMFHDINTHHFVRNKKNSHCHFHSIRQQSICRLDPRVCRRTFLLVDGRCMLSMSELILLLCLCLLTPTHAGLQLDEARAGNLYTRSEVVRHNVNSSDPTCLCVLDRDNVVLLAPN